MVWLEVVVGEVEDEARSGIELGQKKSGEVEGVHML